MPQNVSLSYSRKDQEEQGQRKVQGALQQVPVHPGHHRQGEGREAEAVPASRWAVTIRPNLIHKTQGYFIKKQ